MACTLMLGTVLLSSSQGPSFRWEAFRPWDWAVVSGQLELMQVV